MIRNILIFLLLNTLILSAAELKIASESFEGNEKKGITVFEGNVRITLESDEMNASVVTVYTGKDHIPYKYVAEGNVSFYIRTKSKASYKGMAQKAVFMPGDSIYEFYKDVQLRQLDEHKLISGDEVVVNIKDGTARAKGAAKEPVVMILHIKDRNESK
ncbi:MAG: lipopolysaccharide transport periplasmic protein LptA [Helicobacteraceae bacterium 4484_230]|nr:MAG: lipopolysaccharide transport periplasmic protein LptA [Helicobacteraceae bacterium 4484_230]